MVVHDANVFRGHSLALLSILSKDVLRMLLSNEPQMTVCGRFRASSSLQHLVRGAPGASSNCSEQDPH